MLDFELQSWILTSSFGVADPQDVQDVQDYNLHPLDYTIQSLHAYTQRREPLTDNM
jgi:hypothetical protein